MKESILMVANIFDHPDVLKMIQPSDIHHHPDVSLLWNYWPLYHVIPWPIRYALNAVFFVPYFFTLSINRKSIMPLRSAPRYSF